MTQKTSAYSVGLALGVFCAQCTLLSMDQQGPAQAHAAAVCPSRPLRSQTSDMSDATRVLALSDDDEYLATVRILAERSALAPAPTAPPAAQTVDPVMSKLQSIHRDQTQLLMHFAEMHQDCLTARNETMDHDRRIFELEKSTSSLLEDMWNASKDPATARARRHHDQPSQLEVVVGRIDGLCARIDRMARSVSPAASSSTSGANPTQTCPPLTPAAAGRESGRGHPAAPPHSPVRIFPQQAAGGTSSSHATTTSAASAPVAAPPRRVTLQATTQPPQHHTPPAVHQPHQQSSRSCCVSPRMRGLLPAIGIVVIANLILSIIHLAQSPHAPGT